MADGKNSANTEIVMRQARVSQRTVFIHPTPLGRHSHSHLIGEETEVKKLVARPG